MFHRADLLFQPFEVFFFSVVGFQILHRFNTLLNSIRAGHFRIHGFLIKPFLYLCRKTYNGKRHRHHPKSRQRHTPIVEEQADGNQDRRDDGSGKLRDKVGKALL